MTTELVTAFQAAWTAWRMVRHGGGVKEAAATFIPTWQRDRPLPVSTDYDSLASQGYAQNTLIYACIQELATSSSEAPPRVYIQTRKGYKSEVEGHPLTALLIDPNPFHSGFDLIEDTITCLMIAGNAYWEVERTRAGEPLRLWPLRPSRVEVVPGDSQRGQLVAGYLYTVEDRKVLLDAGDVVHFKLPNPLNVFYGLSPLAVAARVGDLDNSAVDWMRLFFQNAAVPLGIYKTKQRLVQAEAERIKLAWREKYGQPSNWHDIAVIDADGDYQQIGLDLERMAMDSLLAQSEARICSVFGVPPVLVGAKVGLDRSTMANYREARQSLWDESLIPLYKRLASRISVTLLPLFAGDRREKFEFNLDSIQALQEDTSAKWGRAQTALSGGGITVNEFRAEIGKDPLPGGDVLLLPNSVTVTDPQDILGQQERRQEQQAQQRPPALPEPDDGEDEEDDTEEDDTADMGETEKAAWRLAIEQHQAAIDALIGG